MPIYVERVDQRDVTDSGTGFPCDRGARTAGQAADRRGAMPEDLVIPDLATMDKDQPYRALDLLPEGDAEDTAQEAVFVSGHTCSARRSTCCSSTPTRILRIPVGGRPETTPSASTVGLKTTASTYDRSFLVDLQRDLLPCHGGGSSSTTCRIGALPHGRRVHGGAIPNAVAAGDSRSAWRSCRSRVSQPQVPHAVPAPYLSADRKRPTAATCGDGYRIDPQPAVRRAAP